MSTTTNASKLALHGGPPVSSTMIPPVAVKLSEREIDAAVRVMRSGKLAQGEVTAEFERTFAELTGARHAIATNNGTTALQVPYHALLKPGASAVVPSWTFMATASMVRARPGVPIFADVDRELFNLTPGLAEAAIDAKTQAIVPVHLYGNPVDIAGFEALGKKRGVPIIYDAAQAHLATYNGKGLGAFGTCVTYSFYPTKNMTTGEGGMVTTNDDALADEMRMIRNHGMRERYLHEEIGFNYRMTDIAAAIGLAQLETIKDVTAARQANAARLTTRLANLDGIITPVATAGATHSYHQYTIRLKLEKFAGHRDDFIKALAAEGVGAQVHYPRPVHKQPVFEKDSEVDAKSLPVCEQLAKEIICLPVHQHLNDEQVEQIAEAVIKVADALRS
jgi:perosamine synthetase